MKDKFKAFLEGFVVFVIFLVLIQTFLEDYFIVSLAPWQIRKIMIYAGFAFDLFFTVEFLIRSWNAFTSRNFKKYFFRMNGWVDFAASLPLLIFTSGPLFLALVNGYAFSGGATLIGMLKIVKAVRMARVLRLLRLIKIFRHIRFADSAMVQRHTVRIITTVTSALIFSVTIILSVFAFSGISDLESFWAEEQQTAEKQIVRNIENGSGLSDKESISSSVIFVSKSGSDLFSRYESSYLRKYFGPQDYRMAKNADISIWFDLRPSAVSMSKTNITVYAASLFIILLIMIVYVPNFAISISDPVNVMYKGMSEKSYNLEVKIPPEYSREEIFLLAESFNKEFLPLKERASLETNESSALDISLDDIGDLIGGN